MDEAKKDAFKKHLRSYVANIESMREALSNTPDSDEARKALQMAKYDLLNAIHKISWIGEDLDEAIKEYAIKHAVDDNP